MSRLSLVVALGTMFQCAEADSGPRIGTASAGAVAVVTLAMSLIGQVFELAWSFLRSVACAFSKLVKLQVQLLKQAPEKRAQELSRAECPCAKCAAAECCACLWRVPLSMALESEAFFLERARAVGCGDDLVDVLRARGWTTMGRFAFATPQAPGAADDGPFRRDVLASLLGDEPFAADKVAVLRRLFFESYTLVASDMRSRLERNEDDPPKKLPRVERENRVEAVKSRLPGARINDEREPGPSVVNAFVQMGDDGYLQYLPWHKTISAKLEAAEGKVFREWRPNKQGVISERLSKELPTQDVGQDLLKLEHVFVRRAVAMEAARLLSFAAHQRISDKFLEALEDDPADPDRYSRTSVAQVSKCDQEVFTLLSRKVRNGLVRKATGVYPLEEALNEILASARIQQLLQPLPRGARKEPPTASPPVKHQDANKGDKASSSGDSKVLQTILNKLSDLRSGGSSSRQERDKGKGRGRGKGKQSAPRMPKELLGLDFAMANGDPICFAFNLDGCPSARPGERCDKGYHVCMKPRCHKPHSQRKHE